MTETVTAFLTTKNSLYATAITLIAVVSPFLHLFANSGQPGYFGFKYMSSFLYALGWPITVISLGLLLQLAAKLIQNEAGSMFKILSNVVIGLGLFYLLYTLIPMNTVGGKDFSPWVYYLMLLACTVTATYALHLFHHGLQLAEKKLKDYINRLIVFIVNTDKYIESKENRSKHFKAYMEELDDMVE